MTSPVQHNATPCLYDFQAANVARLKVLIDANERDIVFEAPPASGKTMTIKYLSTEFTHFFGPSGRALLPGPWR